MFNKYFENQSIWNTLSTKMMVLSSYHEKGSGPEYHYHKLYFSLTMAQGKTKIQGQNLSKIWQIWLKGRAIKDRANN